MRVIHADDRPLVWLLLHWATFISKLAAAIILKPKRMGNDRMPTVAQINSMRVVIYPNDHRPAHVHAMGSGRDAVFNLHCPDGPPEPRENYGFSLAELRRLLSTLAGRLAHLCIVWSKTHEHF